MEENINKLDIKDFPSLSSAPDTCHILLVQQTGSAGKLTIGLFKTMVKRDVLPSIKDGVWWVGEVDTQVEAIGKSPVFRKGATGIEWKYATAPDEAWSVAASYDSIKLKYEDLTPEQRVDLISLDNMTAAEIARLQQPASDMIVILRNTNESVTAAEALRVEKESVRVTAEGNRVTEESKRDTAERLRAQEETLRKQKEEARVTEESNRQFKESERIKEETARNQKEASRQSAEETRVAHENERDTAESARVATENARKEAENARVTAENIRIDSEKSRGEEYVEVIAQTNEAKNQAIQAAKDVDEATQKALAAADQADTARDQATDAAEQALSAADSVEEAKNQAVQAAGKADESATKADEATVQTNTARDQAAAAALAAKEIAEHQPYIGEDYYFYQWNLATKAYDKTNIYTKGEGFSIFRSYTSVALMRADKAHVPEGRFVMINTGDVENPDNAQVYFRNSSAVDGFDFVVDMSGAIGFTGKTPQFTVGNITTGVEGSPVSMSLSESGTDEGDNPVYAINLSIPRGDKGKIPSIAMGTVATVAPGTPASADLVSDGQLPDGTPRYKLNLSIPKGDQGSLAAGDAKDLTVTFLESAKRENIASGEKLFVILGKVKKWFSDLKTVAFTGKFSDLEERPTTVDGYGITDASKKDHKHDKADISDFPNSMPASDVSQWAKDSKKPSYSASEVGASPADHDHDGTYEPKFEKNSAFNKAFGSASNTVCQGNDSRLADPRAPLAHSHKKSEISDFPSSMPASDVQSWAKQPAKPVYTANEVGALGTDHNTSGAAHQDIRDLIVSYLANAKGYADTKIAALIGSAPDILDTLGELADAIVNNQSAVDAINTAIAQKLGKTEAGQLYVAIQGYVAFSQEEKNKLGTVQENANYFPDAPNDGKEYARKNNMWQITSGGGADSLPVDTILESCMGVNVFSDKWLECNGSVVEQEDYPELNGIDVFKKIRITSSFSENFRAIVFGNGLFVAVGEMVCYTSPDGISWTKRDSLVGSCSTITYGNGLFVAVGYSSCHTSPDGINWTKRNIVLGDFRGVTYGNGQFVTIGDRVCCTSPDGINWTSQYIYFSVNAITYGNGLFVAVGEGGNAYKSPDCINWSSNQLQGSYSAITYGNGLFVAVGDKTGFSLDGIKWNTSSISYGPYYKIAYYNGLFVAISRSSILTSPDGLKWDSRGYTQGSYSAITYGNGQFVIAGSTFCIMLTDKSLPTKKGSYIKVLK